MDKTTNIDVLSINHFLIYFILGLFLKNQYKLIIILSLVWELFEYTISHINYTRQFLINYWFIPEKYWNEPFTNKIYDIIINIIGYYIGNMIHL
jgi:hypothetical protein